MSRRLSGAGVSCMSVCVSVCLRRGTRCSNLEGSGCSVFLSRRWLFTADRKLLPQWQIPILCHPPITSQNTFATEFHDAAVPKRQGISAVDLGPGPCQAYRTLCPRYHSLPEVCVLITCALTFHVWSVYFRCCATLIRKFLYTRRR